MPRNKMNHNARRNDDRVVSERYNGNPLIHSTSLAKGNVLGLTVQEQREAKERSRRRGQPKGAKAMMFCEGCGKAMSRGLKRWNIFRGECTGKKVVVKPEEIN